MKRLFSTFLLLWIAFAMWIPCSANEVEEDENFVIASLLVFSPSDVLYSCVGHACLRMQCPTHNLDYCFSYEGEPVEHQIFRFFAGKLKMGMFAAPTDDYLSVYAHEHRGIKQYRLNLPLEAKRRLWEILDNKAMEGIDLPYDYLERGCAQTTIQFLVQALDTIPISFAPWGEKYNQTVREIFVDCLQKDAPWNLFYLQTIVGTKVDADVPPIKRLVVPSDLVEVLQGATINEQPIISGLPIELLKAKTATHHTLFTPMLIAIVLLLLSVANFWLGWPAIDWLLLGFQFVLGLFLTYLIFISSLPCTTWNWLLIPFNPLPLLLFHWRHRWAVAFAVIVVGWILVMCFYPHQLTDWAYIVLAASLVPVLIRQRNKIKQI